jgi:hypothetical protein
LGQDTREEPRCAFLARHRRGCRIGAEVEGLLADRLGQTREHDVREHDPGHEVDLVALDVALEQLLADVGLELVVADQHLGRQPAELAAVELHRQHERIADIGPQRRGRAGQGAHETDLDLVGRMHGGREAQGRQGERQTARSG